MKNMEDNIEIDDWVTPRGTDSVQQVIDIENIDGGRIFYTNAGLAYTFEQLEFEPEEVEHQYMTDEVHFKLLNDICSN